MIYVNGDRAEGLKVIASLFQDRITEDQVVEFDICPIKSDDETIGMLMIRGPEVHVAILPEYRRRWLTRGLIHEVLDGIENEYGYCLTSCFSDEERNIDFITRLGFKQIHTENGMIFFERVT